MKRTAIFTSISILPLTLVAITLAFAQDQQDKPQDKQNHGQQQKQQSPSKQSGNKSGQQKQMERSEQQVREQQAVQQRAWQERRANHWEYEHRSWKQRGGYQGYRIPDDYFLANYGSSHPFRIYTLPFIYEGGNPRFQYGGYWFTMVDPYPEYWGGTWYENDDVYVDYSGDGYYLFNRKHPGHPGVAVLITF